MLDAVEDSEHHYKLEVARHRLKTYSGSLIVFDNLETRQAIEEYLPDPQARPHILVTAEKYNRDLSPLISIPWIKAIFNDAPQRGRT